MESALTRGEGVANKLIKLNLIKLKSYRFYMRQVVFLNTSALLNTDGSSKISRGPSKSDS